MLVILLPCLNPIGFTRNQCENIDGIDLNRCYRNPRAAETCAHIVWLERQPSFDFYLCLHEDWESHGFYLYEQNPDAKLSPAENMITAGQEVCPVDLSESTRENGVASSFLHCDLKLPDGGVGFYAFHRNLPRRIRQPSVSIDQQAD